MFWKVLLIIALILLTTSCTIIASFGFENGRPKVIEKEQQQLPATIYYDTPDSHPSHFATLTIRTNGSYSDNDQAYAAGYLEGMYTAQDIYNLYLNTRNIVNESGYVPQNLSKFFYDQDQWVNSQIQKYPDDPFWQYISTLQQQAQGIQEGYLDSEWGQQHKLDSWPFQFLESVGDIFDIRVATNRTLVEEFKKMSFEERLEQKYFCTAMIKVGDSFEDIYAGHSTWWSFASMIRIFKRYEFSYNNPSIAAKKTVFSSYPGMVSSWDDFYMMDSKLLMVQTTNNIADPRLYDIINPQTLYSWQRVRVANAFSKSGKDWYKYISMYNSGTYTNMYMILNYGLFTPGNALVNDTLWVIETAPGLVFGQDKTNHLNRQYWPSFNTPYFPVMYDWMGYNLIDMQNNHTNGTEYQQYFRSQISRREENKIQDLDSFRYFLRYNEYQTDPFSMNNPYYSICARGDLNQTVPKLAGCTDTKYTNLALFNEMKAWAINGPTAQDLPPFEWKPQFNTTTHVGVPNMYNFTFELMEPLPSTNAIVQ